MGNSDNSIVADLVVGTVTADYNPSPYVTISGDSYWGSLYSSSKPIQRSIIQIILGIRVQKINSYLGYDFGGRL